MAARPRCRPAHRVALWTFVFLAVALVAGVWAHRNVAAAMWGVVGTVGAGLFSAAVVAASFSHVEERGSLNYLAEVPFHIGRPRPRPGRRHPSGRPHDATGDLICDHPATYQAPVDDGYPLVVTANRAVLSAGVRSSVTSTVTVPPWGSASPG